MEPGSPAIAPPLPANWWERNWKWVVPVGVVVGVAAIAGFVVAILLAVSGMFTHSEPYREALARARADARVVEAFGEPIEPGWGISGNINLNGPSGHADFSVPLRGASGRGTLYVTAEKETGRWHYKALEVAIDGRPDRVDLLSGPAPASGEERGPQ